jgi:uncharacterized protein (TIGR01319 family)
VILNSEYIFITDIGSTTTKGLLIKYDIKNNRYNFLAQADAYTTVEKPYEDVNIGILKAAESIEQKSGVKLLDHNKNFIIPYITTSSAGGGLQILVCGLTKSDTGKNAEITAMGAGGVVLRTFTIDDNLSDFERVRIIRDLNPDMILIAGGYEGGNSYATMRQLQLMILASPRNRFDKDEKVPLIFCGNTAMQKFVNSMLDSHFIVSCTENIRPDYATYNYEPAKQKIHEVFKDSVMEHAPGYRKLKKQVSEEIKPTPTAVERMLKLYTEKHKENIIAIDMGGATTDIYSWINGFFHRTVSANVGLSFSMANILATVLKSKDFSGLKSVLPQNYSEDDVRNYINNKTLNPSYLPKSDPERYLEQICAELGFRLSLDQHLDMNFNNMRNDFFDGIRDVYDSIFYFFRSVYGKYKEEFFSEDGKYCEEAYSIDMENEFHLSDIQTIIGSGGVIAYAQNREEQIFMLNEGLKPYGITKLVIDMPFKVSHMGILSYSDPEAALEMFERECLRTAAVVIAPLGKIKPGKPAVYLKTMGSDEKYLVKGGQVLYSSSGAKFEIISANRNIKVDKNKSSEIIDTELPVLIDCRGRGKYFQGEHLLKSGVKEFQFNYGTFVSNIPLNRIRTDDIKFEEKEFTSRLPHEGQILTEERNTVRSGDIIGKNESANREYFYIDLGNLSNVKHKYTETEIKQRLTIKKGQEVKTGDVIFNGLSEHPVASQGMTDGNLVEVDFKAVKSGIVSEIYYDLGLIAFQVIERNETAVIDVATPFLIKPKNIKTYLSVMLGDPVRENQIIAFKYGINVKKIAIKSPIKGIVTEIDLKKGTVTIENKLTPYIMRSFVSGRVSAVEPGIGVTVTAKCAVLNGASGFGGETYGEALFIERRDKFINDIKTSGNAVKEYAGRILVFKESINLPVLEAAKQLKVNGVIAPSVNNRDWTAFCKDDLSISFTGDEDFGFSLVLIKGFGKISMEEDTAELFKRYHLKEISISGRTQIRAGIIRPQIILPENG